MFTVHGNPILNDPMEVLTELRAQLAINKIDRFHTLKYSGRNIMTNCPHHGGGQESKPSCGILTSDRRNSKGEIEKAGKVHCFSCGYNVPLEEMISNCFGHNDFGIFGTQWLAKNFLTVSIENRKPIELGISRGVGRIILPTAQYISEEELDSYRYIHPYMHKRKLTDEIIEKFDIGYDPHFVLEGKDGKKHRPMKCITFPVRDAQGNVLFIARRSVDTKFFHYPLDVQKPVYGVYELPLGTTEVVLCESFINTLTSYVYGKPSLALLGTGDEHQYDILEALPIRKYILALDPDNAGISGMEKLRKRLRHKIITQYVVPKGKDINDLSKEEFDNLPEIF